MNTETQSSKDQKDLEMNEVNNEMKYQESTFIQPLISLEVF